MTDIEIAAQRQFQVKVSGIDGLWAKMTGGESTSETTKVHNGGELTPVVLTAPPQHSDVVVTRPYSAARDEPLLARLLPLVGQAKHTITRQPTNKNMVRTGQPRHYHGLLTGAAGPDVDSGGSSEATITLTFSISRVT